MSSLLVIKKKSEGSKKAESPLVWETLSDSDFDLGFEDLFIGGRWVGTVFVICCGAGNPAVGFVE